MSQWGLARLRSTSGPHRGAGAGQGLRRTTVGRWPPNHKPCTSKCPATCTLVGSVWQLEQTCAWQGMLPCRTAMAVGPPATSCHGCSLPGPCLPTAHGHLQPAHGLKSPCHGPAPTCLGHTAITTAIPPLHQVLTQICVPSPRQKDVLGPAGAALLI